MQGKLNFNIFPFSFYITMVLEKNINTDEKTILEDIILNPATCPSTYRTENGKGLFWL